jgi:hypothetical protein
MKLSNVIKNYILSKITPDFRRKNYFLENLDFYRDLIVESAEKKNYCIKISKETENLINTKVGPHEVWEIREIENLGIYGKLEEVDFVRKNRRFHLGMLKHLEKLIKAIEKGKNMDEAFNVYAKYINNKPKIKTFCINIEENIKKFKISSPKAKQNNLFKFF